MKKITDLKCMYPTKEYVAIGVYYSKEHMAVDLCWNSKYGGKNQPIVAPYDGKVVAIKDHDKTNKSWGNYVKIDIGKFQCKYRVKRAYILVAHLEEGIKVKVGQKVKMGDLLGHMGNTGRSFGNHTHYEFYLGGASTKYRVDPEKYTYVYPKQKVSSNKSATKGLKYIK